MQETTLLDLGERRILREIIPRFVTGAGDDCAALAWEAPFVCVTTDPVPRPAAEVIGGDDDAFWLGWLLVTINASDLAAAGARPQAFVAALDLPSTYTVRSLERLLEGIQRSCAANGLKYVGGNLREAKQLGAVGTAFGASKHKPLTRVGAQKGDLLLALGQSGRFWSDVELIRSGGMVEKVRSPVFSPVSQSQTVCVLHEAGLLRCAMDTSDGLAPSIEELARTNNLTIGVDIEAIRRESKIAGLVGNRPERYWFGWGDWTVIAAVSPGKLDSVAAAMAGQGTPWAQIGTFEDSGNEVFLRDGSRHIRAARLESERFTPDSWFTEGIDGYIRRLNEYPLP